MKGSERCAVRSPSLCQKRPEEKHVLALLASQATTRPPSPYRLWTGRTGNHPASRAASRRVWEASLPRLNMREGSFSSQSRHCLGRQAKAAETGEVLGCDISVGRSAGTPCTTTVN